MKTFRVLSVLLLSVFAGTASADCCLPFCAEIGAGYDYFRSLPEGDWEGNTGALVTANVGGDFCYCDQLIGVQLGGSFGIYDWNGNLSADSDLQSGTQKQAFVTAGFSWRTQCESGFNLGLVYDWMWNEKLGVFRPDVNVSQIRLQGGYQLCCRDEFGLWGAFHLCTAEREVEQIPIEFRGISQVNLFWRHTFENCAETKIWVGAPVSSSLMFDSGRSGQFIVGGSFYAPLACRLGIEGHASYMHPHSASDNLRSRLYGANIYIGLTYAFGGSGYCRKPYLEVANNSNFYLDTDLNF